MLVISRKVGESVVISDNIKITVVAIANDKISFGIEAPREITIVRDELLETIKANRASTDNIDSNNHISLAKLIKNNLYD